MNNNEFSIKTDIMRYKPNQLSFLFCVLAIVLNVAMFLIIYQETNCKSNYLLGIDLVINVVFMLAVFLLSEKSKAYNLKAGYVALVMGLIEIGRIFFIPLYYHNKHLEYLKTEEGVIGIVKVTWRFVPETNSFNPAYNDDAYYFIEYGADECKAVDRDALIEMFGEYETTHIYTGRYNEYGYINHIMELGM